SGWREMWEEQERCKLRYGSDKRWDTWFTTRAEVLARTRTWWKITDNEADDRRHRLRWWPLPGRMASLSGVSAATSAYLEYLNDWFYRELSSHSHGSLPGLAERSRLLMDKDSDRRLDGLDRFRGMWAARASTVFVALLSEVQAALEYGLRAKLQ